MRRTIDLVQMLKDQFRDGAILRWIQRRKDQTTLADWKKAGRPQPAPPAFKRQLIRDVAKQFGIHVLVETGTFFGNTVAASLGTFDMIYSIELFKEHYCRAVRRFARHRRVTLFYGDSAQELPRILTELRAPSVFWLDAHYSGDGTAKADMDTPVVQELLAISRHPVRNHVILVDDARLFDGTSGYPTIDGVRKIAVACWPQHKIDIVNDVITILPSTSP